MRSFYLDPDSWVDIWNERIFRVGLSLVAPATQTQEDFTGFFTTGVDTLIETYLVSNNNDSVRCTFVERVPGTGGEVTFSTWMQLPDAGVRERKKAVTFATADN